MKGKFGDQQNKPDEILQGNPLKFLHIMKIFYLPYYLFVLANIIILSCNNKNNLPTDSNKIPINNSKEINPLLSDLNLSDTLPTYLKNLNFDRDHLNEALIMVFKRDQQYRDSSNNPLVQNKERRFNRPMRVCVSINQKIVKYILDHHRWPRGMTQQANLGMFLTILHSSDKVFLPHVRDAFNKKIITSQYYANLIDDIVVRNYGKQLFGTYPLFHKNGERYFPPGISLSIDSMNFNRKSIGLEPLKVSHELHHRQ